MTSTLARFNRLRREERGAEAVEFALVGPLLFFLLFGVLYLLFLVAAQVSVARSAAVGARYAAIKDQALGTYPSAAQVQSQVLNQTALFAAGDCRGVFDPPATGPNTPLTLKVTCEMPNPIGRSLHAFRSVLFGGGGSEGAATLELTADAQARRE
ncbi:MAG: TadE/TadG family type IV pilus assembly protein [Actinomycetota bacterium]